MLLCYVTTLTCTAEPYHYSGRATGGRSTVMSVSVCLCLSVCPRIATFLLSQSGTGVWRGAPSRRASGGITPGKLLKLYEIWSIMTQSGGSYM